MRKTVLLYPAVRLTVLLLSVCFLLTSVFPCITYAGNSDNGPAITSPAAILMEASTGQVIYEKDLTQHQTVSGEDMSYFDDEAKEKYIPYVIEPSLGADRVTLAFLCSAYDEEELEGGDVRTVLHFHPALAPVKIGVLPLSKKLNEGAEKVFAELSKTYNCEFDDRGNIGKRYRRQDEIGTPFCITYDFDSEEDNAVTVRDRDTMEQERVKIADLKAYFADKFTF
jgi:glycyl-tRNA synthetase